MGREADCSCDWNGERVAVKALIEPPQLILRGGLRRRLPFAQVEQIDAHGDMLHFKSQGESFALQLGNKLARQWARAITAPPPSLAKKLGITNDIVVRMLGAVDDEPLREALATAKAISDQGANLIVARVNARDDLEFSLRTAAQALAAGVPIWFVYPKGRGHALSENDVRSMALANGIVDTKVAAVSPRLTGLRFVKRRS
ncbi:MAG TPA: hypothetical protein VGG85_02800 [Terracidiphilus sp.]|jgi:hypothetical protein